MRMTSRSDWPPAPWLWEQSCSASRSARPSTSPGCSRHKNSEGMASRHSLAVWDNLLVVSAPVVPVMVAMIVIPVATMIVTWRIIIPIAAMVVTWWIVIAMTAAIVARLSFPRRHLRQRQRSHAGGNEPGRHQHGKATPRQQLFINVPNPFLHHGSFLPRLPVKRCSSLRGPGLIGV